MEKTVSLFEILRLGLKEIFQGKKDIISDEKIESGEISDAEFEEIAKDLEPEIIAQLQKTRNGRGADKLENSDRRSFVKKVSTTPSKNTEKIENIKTQNREIEDKDLNREI